MVLRAGFDTIRDFVRSRVEFRHIESSKHLSAREHDPGMRPVKLVRRANEEIAAQIFDVDEFMCGEMNGINKAKCSLSMRQFGNLFDWVDRSEGIRSGPDRHKPRARCDRALQLVPYQLPCLQIEGNRS